MNQPIEESVLAAARESEALFAAAQTLALAGGGLPAVTAGLQETYGQDEETACELAAGVFSLTAMRLAELSDLAGHTLALDLAPFAEFVPAGTGAGR